MWGKDNNGPPGNDGHRWGAEDMAIMASPQAGKTTANNNVWARPSIDAWCRKVERGMMAVQPAGSRTRKTHKNGLPILVTFHSLQFDFARTNHKRRHQKISSVQLVWALAIPWSWYQQAATRGPWCEPITSFGWLVWTLFWISRLFGKQTCPWYCLGRYIRANSVWQETTQENDRYHFTHKPLPKFWQRFARITNQGPIWPKSLTQWVLRGRFSNVKEQF